MRIYAKPGVTLEQIAGADFLISYGEAVPGQRAIRKLNGTGAFYWKILASAAAGVTSEELVDAALKEFNAEPEQIRAGLIKFLNLLERDGYIRYVPEAYRGVFRARIAGIVAEIHTPSAYVREYMKDYLMEDPDVKADIVIRNSLEYTRRVGDALAEVDKRTGMSAIPRSPEQIECEAVHMQLAERLADLGILEIHGAAVVLDGEAYIFVAPSGTGKSTHAQLWVKRFGGHAFILNDDKPLLRVSEAGDRVTVYGSPWCGKHRIGRPASAPLRALGDLKRGESNQVKRIRHGDMMELLIRYTIRPRSPEVMMHVMATEAKIVRLVPGFQIRCNQDDEAAEVIYQGIEKQLIDIGGRADGEETV